MSCTRCSKSHSTVQAFLLTCNGCSRKWHHRCHIPLVSDQELILRIKAHNSGDLENGLQAWRCKRCTRGGTASVSGTPAPQASSVPPQPQPISRQPPLRNVPPSESRQLTSMPQNVTRISNTPDIPPNVNRVDASQGQRGTGGHPARSSVRARATIASRRLTTDKDDDVIVIEDSDSDSSRDAFPESTQGMGIGSARTSGTNSTKRPRIDKPVTRVSKTTHPFAEEEEESSDSLSRPSGLPSRSNLNQPPQPITSKQPPVHVGVKKVGNDSSLDPKNLASGSTNTNQPLSKSDKDVMRNQFRRNAAEKEKRRRLEHRQRQQQLFQAKIEEKESVEGITLNVVDLDLNNNQRASATPTEQPLPSTVTSEADNAPLEIIPMTASTPAKAVNEPSFAIHWFDARANGDDIWERALKKKESIPSPSTARRKITARKLGDAQPQLFQFNVGRWVDASKGRHH